MLLNLLKKKKILLTFLEILIKIFFFQKNIFLVTIYIFLIKKIEFIFIKIPIKKKKYIEIFELIPIINLIIKKKFMFIKKIFFLVINFFLILKSLKIKKLKKVKFFIKKKFLFFTKKMLNLNDLKNLFL
jgi:hypothetical protein